MRHGQPHARVRQSRVVAVELMMRWFSTGPPRTTKRPVPSMSAIWSGRMSQARSYSPDSSPFTRADASGTSRNRTDCNGGRPPQ